MHYLTVFYFMILILPSLLLLPVANTRLLLQRMIEITSSRTELEEQSTYPLPSAAAAATDEAGTSAAGAALSAPPATAVPLVDLTAPPSTSDSLLSHVIPFSLMLFVDYWERDQRSRWE